MSGWSGFRARWLILLPLAAVWLALCWHLSHHWDSDPQYAFGWLVPPLAVYLALRRWKTRPAPETARVLPVRAIFCLAAFAFAVLWLIVQPNPDWRLASWLFAAVVAVLTLACCALAGGQVWGRHFAFPACFILTAIPWPTGFETWVVQGLMRFVAAITVEVLNLTGIIAVQRGNLIEVGAGLLGVDEACSGVRSLQASLMIALFLGELLGVAPARRLVLVVAGLAAALAGNVVRASILARTAAGAGLDAVGQWHDPAGYTILIGSFILTWLLALRLAPPLELAPAPARRHPANPIAARVAIGFSLWVGAVLLGTEWWFRAAPPPAVATWKFAPPRDAAELQDVPIDPGPAAMLRFDVNGSKAWREPDGHAWLAYYFEWREGPARSRILARVHRPDICLTALGHRLTADRGPLTIPARGVEIPFLAYTFTARGSRAHVYYCLWEAGGVRASLGTGPAAQLAGLRAVLERRRHLRQQVLELVLFEYETAEAADAALRRRLPDLIEATAPPR